MGKTNVWFQNADDSGQIYTQSREKFAFLLMLTSWVTFGMKGNFLKTKPALKHQSEILIPALKHNTAAQMSKPQPEIQITSRQRSTEGGGALFCH